MMASTFASEQKAVAVELLTNQVDRWQKSLGWMSASRNEENSSSGIMKK